jgi:hypothetical protein
MRLVAAGRGLHALLGLSSVPAPMYLGTNGSNPGGGGALETLVPRFVPLSSIWGGGAAGAKGGYGGYGRGADGWGEGNWGGAGVHF